ncbi:hypothetical protein SLA2020_160880 [Shorea laevis]
MEILASKLQTIRIQGKEEQHQKGKERKLQHPHHQILLQRYLKLMKIQIPSDASNPRTKMVLLKLKKKRKVVMWMRNRTRLTQSLLTPEPPKDYIHVRARRGQATDSHSLAERVRREKISERMKLLQDLVPGCKQPLMSRPLNVNGRVKRGANLPPVGELRG